MWFARGQLWAQQRLNGVKLTQEQFPEAYAMLVDAAARSGLSYVPDAYVVLGNGVINAAASGHGFRRFVFISSDLLEVGGAAREPEALRFVIAHEVGHIAAGHVSYWRILATFASQWIPIVGSTLSRAQEYTADNYGHALAPQGARLAMATLAGGSTSTAPSTSTPWPTGPSPSPASSCGSPTRRPRHPALLWRMHALRDRRRPGRLLWRPREPWLWGGTARHLLAAGPRRLPADAPGRRHRDGGGRAPDPDEAVGYDWPLGGRSSPARPTRSAARWGRVPRRARAHRPWPCRIRQGPFDVLTRPRPGPPRRATGSGDHAGQREDERWRP